MCGITGYWGKSERTTLERMTKALAHRGPDDSGVNVFPNAGLGHRRLSIIDLSANAHQPMSDASSQLWISFNGEIYNYLDNRRFLETKGYRFQSRSDTETILYLYKEFGIDCVKRLNGIFSFAILDLERNQMFLARDHFGVKPLFYYRTPQTVYFASELTGLFEVPELKPTLNLGSAAQYLYRQYVAGSSTLVNGVLKLPPAHSMLVSPRGVSIQRYWQLEVIPESEKRILSLAKSTQDLADRLEATVKDQMISDVPVGAFLSGGLDSSLVSSMMARHTDAPLHTYSIGFAGDTAHDESRFSSLVAKSLGTTHHHMLFPSVSPAQLERLVQRLDEPIADPAVLPTFRLSEEARRTVKVVLTGEGADEVFAGYKQYVLESFAGRMFASPSAFRLLRALPLIGRKRSFSRAINAFASSNPAQRWLDWNCVCEKVLLEALLNPEVLKAVDLGVPSEWAPVSASIAPLDQQLLFDLSFWLPDDLLAKVDRTTMAFGLEARVPYLSPDLVTFCFTLPVEFKLHSFQTKRILREVGSRLLPAAIIRRPKHGFNLPTAQWFRTTLKDYVYNSLEFLDSTGLVRHGASRGLMDRTVSNQEDHSRLLFAMVMLSEWMQLRLVHPAGARSGSL
jgi:asparagine synthase (glutamine-hydrolysing)